jgi:hypothetical protein
MPCNKSSKPAGWIGLLFGVCLAWNAGFGQQYQVEGTVSATAFEENGKPQREPMESRVFVLCVSNHTWEMTLKLSTDTAAYYRKKASQTGRPFDMSDYERLTFDGTDLYCFEDAETAIAKYAAKMRAAGMPIPAENDNRAEAAVTGLEVPHYVEGDSEIWLTYASSAYFRNLTTNRAEVAWRWGFPEVMGMLLPGESIKRHATWEFQPDTPQLPSSVTYYLGDTGNLTNAQYTVRAYTKFRDLMLSKESTLEVYRVHRSSPSSTNMILSIRYVVRATAFKPLETGFTFPPEVPVLTAVTDHRFNSPTDPAPETSVPYMIEGQFLTRDEARKTGGYAEFKLGIKNTNRMDSFVVRRNRQLEAVSDKTLADLQAMPARERRRKIVRWSATGVVAVSAVAVMAIVIRKRLWKRA